VWQPKVDDWRAVVHAPSGTVWNQYGRLSSFTDTDKFASALAHLYQAYVNRVRSRFPVAEWLDVGMMENRNDMMRGCIIVFDLIEAGMEFWQRRERLRSMFQVLPYVPGLLTENGGQVRDQVYLIPQWHGPRDPLALYRLLQSENDEITHKFYEGIVAKRVHSFYTFGRRPKQLTPDWIKHRFDQIGGQP
jgi:hypothetical protein